MSNDLLITPGSRKQEFKDSSGNVDAKIETDANGNLLITNPGGDISIGDTTADIFVGDGTNNVDIVFEQDGEIRGTSGVTVTLGASGSNVRMASDLNLNGNNITGAGDITLTGNLNVTGDINSTSVTDLDVVDKTITVGVGQSAANSGDSGLIIAGSNKSLLWKQATTEFAFNDDLHVGGTLSWTGVGTGNGSGISSLNASNISSGTLNTARLSSHLDIGGRIDFNVGSNYGTTTAADRLWISSHHTGQSDVPGNYYDIINLSSASTHGVQIASHYASSATTPVYIRTRSDNNNAPNGAGLQPWALIWTDRTDGAGSGLDADKLDGQHGSHYLDRANHTGTLTLGTVGTFNIEGGSADWNTTTPGTSTGSLHLDPGSATNNFGSAITFGASDTSNGETAQAGIYIRSDGGYGTKMYIATTNSYASGSKTTLLLNSNGDVSVHRGALQIAGVDVIDENKNLVNIGTISSGAITSSAHVSATDFRPTNIVTNKVVKFNGTSLDDSNITDTGSLITLGSNTTVSGTFSATSKSFDIEHPTKENMRLHHGVLEGPEHAVYIRGKSNSYIIELPDYWEGLVHEDTITVQITPIGNKNNIWIENIEDNKVYLECDREMKHYFYFIQAERKDVERFEVEYGNSI